MPIAQALVGALALALLAATLLPLSRTQAWWIRALEFPRLQIAALLLLTLGLSVLVFAPTTAVGAAIAALLAAALAYQLARVLPYTPLVRPQVLGERAPDKPACIRLMTANVLMENRQADAFLALVRASDPDIVLAVETDRWWDAQLAQLDAMYPFSVKRPIENTYGMHLFSRLELRDPQLRFLVEDDIPSIRTSVRLRSGAWIELHCVHPRPPLPGQDTEERDAELIIVGKEVKARGLPSIVAGDLNDVAWSDTTRLFQKISGTLDPRVGRGPYSTFHADYPVLRWALDHIFHEASFTLVEIRRLGSFGSDHLPMLVELCYRPKAEAVQEAPRADAEDRREAQEKLDAV